MKKFKVSEKIFILLIGILILFLCLNIYSYIFIKNGIAIPCLFNKITHLYCPGCGVTRMIIAILKLDFYQAFRYNPLLFISMPFIIICLIDMMLKWLLDRYDYLYKRINNRIWIILLVIVIVFGVIRNIPCFDYLIPTVI